MKHALWQATIALVVLVIAMRVVARLLPPLMPYLALLFMFAVIWRVLTYYMK